ncbi:MAG: tyrosine-type recombinase/integrase [Bacteroidales bacterium]|nr:tyrosine-type recombinase/integrase [Bacteroidales bacterium]
MPRNLKHRTCLSLAYSGGLRISELAHLMPEDLDRSRMQILVFHGKGPRTRYVPLARNMLGLLNEYQRFYRTQKYLFEGQKPGVPIATTTLGIVFRTALKKAGIQKKWILNL